MSFEASIRPVVADGVKAPTAKDLAALNPTVFNTSNVVPSSEALALPIVVAAVNLTILFVVPLTDTLVPLEPEEPAAPVFPLEPLEPEEPAAPVAPFTPDVPLEPEEPADPV